MSTPAEETQTTGSITTPDSDEIYRQLADDHRRFDNRLNELLRIHYPSADEQREEVILKKLKLDVKDRMEALRSSGRTPSLSA